MFESEKRELLDLFLRVQEETNAYISIRYDTDCGVSIWIMDDGFNSEGKYDGNYTIYGNTALERESKENYKKAKAHILRLLEKGRCPV